MFVEVKVDRAGEGNPKKNLKPWRKYMKETECDILKRSK